MLIATRVLDLELDLLTLHILDPLVNVEHRGFILLVEDILEEVANETSFPNRGVASQHNFYGLGPVSSHLDLSAIFRDPSHDIVAAGILVLDDRGVRRAR